MDGREKWRARKHLFKYLNLPSPPESALEVTRHMTRGQ